MENKLIPTNGLWNKIKLFFKSIFQKDIPYIKKEKQVNKTDLVNKKSFFTDSLKEQFESNNKNALADKLLYGEVGISELNEKEVDEMKDFFDKDIYNIDSELTRIKEHILVIQQKLKQE